MARQYENAVIEGCRHFVVSNFPFTKSSIEMTKLFRRKPQIQPHSIPDPGLLLPLSLLFIKYAF
jgi:hypothetical protein